MTINPFQQFMSAMDRDIERRRIEAMPDMIPSPTELGRKLGIMVPNYAKPGMAEKVARQAFETECAANPPRSSVELLQRLHEINRFEERMKREREE